MIFLSYKQACPHSLMDRVIACGAIDRGSTPLGDT